MIHLILLLLQLSVLDEALFFILKFIEFLKEPLDFLGELLDLEFVVGLHLHQLAQLIFILLFPKVGLISLLGKKAIRPFHVKRGVEGFGLSELSL